ncbi:MAG: SDR family NAD(P)-dependent oxidoreductase [Bdellovibrionales bacterium]|nr:SDR family NAD(P)-dependent oxidoreductase [Bdellovibrionales bacterium]
MKTILLTGASSGLGRALSQALIKKNSYRLILTARSESIYRFKDKGIYESENIHIRPLDVSNDDQRRAIIFEAEDKWDGIDILINNAGIAYRSVVEHVIEKERLMQMQVNFRSPMELARLCLPKMRAKRWGRIINISSVGGMMAMPTMSVYSASKWALEGASEALYYEVKPWNIKVTLIEPGFINSAGFTKVIYTELSEMSKKNLNDPYYPHYTYMTPFIEKMMRLSPSTPESVAKKVVKIIEQKNPPLRTPATLDAAFFYYLRRLLPGKFYHWVLYKNLPRISEWGKNKTSN